MFIFRGVLFLNGNRRWGGGDRYFCDSRGGLCWRLDRQGNDNRITKVELCLHFGQVAAAFFAGSQVVEALVATLGALHRLSPGAVVFGRSLQNSLDGQWIGSQQSQKVFRPINLEGGPVLFPVLEGP